MKARRNKLVALGLLLTVMTTACGGKGSAPIPPETYSIGGNSAPPLDTLLSEGGSLVSVEELTADGTPVSPPPEDSVEPDASANPDASPAPEVQQFIYTYAELPQGGPVAQTYVETLIAEENGFLVVDEENKAAEAPDYTAVEGTVLLVKPADQEGKLFRIRLDWTETSCTVAVDQPGGSMQKEEASSMTVAEAIDYVKSLSPAALGLEGNSMEPYNVYNIDGLVMVDGVPCMEFRVYSRSEEGTNDVAGIYLISGDKSKIYRLDKAAGTIEALG